MTLPNSTPITPSDSTPITPSDSTLCTLIRDTLQEGQADDVAILDLRERSHLMDYLIFASGRSSRHLWALTKAILNLRSQARKSFSVEGSAESSWILIDGVDVVIHLFRPETRRFYDLESFWRDDDPFTEENVLNVLPALE